MDEDEDQKPEDVKLGTNDVDGRAFEGHPDHPPQAPDQPADGNEDMLRSGN